ncbi:MULTISPECIES: hypothetical protein [Brachybacterium]|uniref:PH domain-containing protein n=1 Tax=Brachybacterium alimentarium TaxID=47845 RepID=A0A2A3YLB5_9MICO|nr:MULTISPECIES: hypothetical protein [Brachybacterium]PCC34756.1 hypothetical protein CIK71_04205 [Brachybacterium alimentarium]PCC40136.1 hypothetical protein CIK66_05740 [Brachybacterium alimentarium]RCS63618.1 hypothetical protein CIK81_11970 [Brachybacterium sp. JB7]RCS69388.1 hypothetical protein CIK73_05510 [Brachybacterium alimentarium]RCS71400.1 hypothetical protein CIK68_10520 [Brachybacterium alimentarium]
MSSSPDLVHPAGDDSLPTRTFGPPVGVVLGTLGAGFVFAVVLEFLVIISFVGQRLWRDPALMHDIVFTLPLLLWVLVAAATAVVCLRILTAWLQIDAHGFVLRSLARRTRAARWDEVGRVIAVRDIDRGASAAELLEASETTYDGVYVMDRQGRRMLAVSSRFFGPRAQEMTLQRAREAGVRIDHVDVITAADLRSQAPQAMSVVDRHPNLLLLLLAVFYTAHNVLTFAVWGL